MSAAVSPSPSVEKNKHTRSTQRVRLEETLLLCNILQHLIMGKKTSPAGLWCYDILVNIL